MSHENNGSKPGLERTHLTGSNTIPSVEFTIPPSDPAEHHLTKCPSRRTQCDDAQANAEKDGLPLGDEEAQSEGEVTYPEGGLQAWLVVLGSFSGTIVAFGMM